MALLDPVEPPGRSARPHDSLMTQVGQTVPCSTALPSELSFRVRPPWPLSAWPRSVQADLVSGRRFKGAPRRSLWLLPPCSRLHGPALPAAPLLGLFPSPMRTLLSVQAPPLCQGFEMPPGREPGSCKLPSCAGFFLGLKSWMTTACCPMPKNTHILCLLV